MVNNSLIQEIVRVKPVLGHSHAVGGLLAFLEDRRASVGPMPCYGRYESSIKLAPQSSYSNLFRHANDYVDKILLRWPRKLRP